VIQLDHIVKENDPGILGFPYHGRLVNGMLLLPATVQVTNTAGNFYLPNGRQVYWSADYSAYYFPLTAPSSSLSFYVKKPGIAPIVRTPAEQAWDQANGYEWRNDAILYGGFLYGKSLGSTDRFLFFGTDGSRWLIDVSGITITDGNTLGGSISATKFGEFGGTSEVITAPVSVNDLGQATPTLSYSGTIDFQNDDPATRTIKATTVRVSDTTSSGDKAILGLYDTQSRSAANPAIGRWSDWDGYKYNAITFWPLGFVELSLSYNPNGSPKITATCTVSKTREQVLGGYSSSSVPASVVLVDQNGDSWYGYPMINTVYSITDRILGMGYTKANALFEIKLSFSETISGTSSYATDPTGVTGMTGSTTTTASLTLSVGSQSKTINYTGSSTSTWGPPSVPIDQTNYEAINTVSAEQFTSGYTQHSRVLTDVQIIDENHAVYGVPAASSVGFRVSTGSSQNAIDWDRYQMSSRVIATLLDADTAQVGDLAAVKFNLGLQGNKLAVHRAKAYRELDGSQNGLLYSDAHYLKTALAYNSEVNHITPNDIYQENVTYASSPLAFGVFDPYNEAILWPYASPIWVV